MCDELGWPIQLLSRKGVYPYEYMDSIVRFDETTLPGKEAFYSGLTDSRIGDEGYQHVTNVLITQSN